jgi:hypothetical protein
MWVRLLSGRYAGEERDVRPDQARVMLADGRAVLPAYAAVPEAKPPVVTRKNRGQRNG